MIITILIIVFIVIALITVLLCKKQGNKEKKVGGTKLFDGNLCDAIHLHAKSQPILHQYVGASEKKIGGNKSKIEIFQHNIFPELKTIKMTSKWQQYSTWDLLKKHKTALKSYIKDKHNILINPDLNWGKVLDFVLPKLYDNYEYIGLVNVENDNKTMYITDIFKSDIQIGSIDSETTFASISSKLVEQVGRTPALFMFHTHPAHVEACPLPSSQDLSTAIYYATNGYYAASMIVSRYGIILYGLEDDMLKYFYKNNRHDFNLARAHYTHDVVAAHESIRSWSAHTLQDYVDFYKRYRMFLYIYPSSEFVAQHKPRTFDLLSPIDHEIIEMHKNDIDDFKGKKFKLFNRKVIEKFQTKYLKKDSNIKS